MSDRYKKAISRGHRRKSKVEVYSSGLYQRNLLVESGSAEVDEENSVHRRCSLTLKDDGELTASQLTDLLMPLGNEIKLFSGIDYRDGTDEMLPLGVFGIKAPKFYDGGSHITITIEAHDRSRRVARARTPDVYTIVAGTNYSRAIQEFIMAGVPGLSYSFAATGHTTPQIVIESGKDRWEEARKLAEAIGMDLFFDAQGVCTLRPVTSESDPVDWTYSDGDQSTMLFVEKAYSDEDTYSHIVVTGESNDAPPVRAEAVDSDPLSPTYIHGKFGDVVRFFSSPLITTEQQAQDVANAQLTRYKGAIEDAYFSSIVNPAHETGDTISVVRPRMKMNAKYSVRTIVLPLTTEQAMYITTRKRRI